MRALALALALAAAVAELLLSGTAYAATPTLLNVAHDRMTPRPPSPQPGRTA